ncbi:hypothetical protein [Cylindrospermum sp. FACHB-282]|uniref:hypothetical protein n=1 Tax=Cylindrospermum sp. FACHB-282 TaxID=2692794 RepID=UPI001685A327|nr:hypothetical protein [Cylindrospermum sp. FACHB-282]MBD2386399.1 hypothetical protein [Cylindrospermum sp. FACHB-282]
MDVADKIIDLTGCQIWDRQEVKRIPINGNYTLEELTDLLKKHWIPFFECHQCGRFDYCKFVEVTSYTDKAKDIQCGVAVTSLKALITRCISVLQILDSQKLQYFLDAAYHFTQFIYKSELRTGNFISTDHLDYFNNLVPMAFSQIIDLRNHLTKFSYEMSRFPEFRSRQSILLVEGYSEKVFIERLKHSGLACFLYITVKSD